jgi:hypothetical protein
MVLTVQNALFRFLENVCERVRCVSQPRITRPAGHHNRHPLYVVGLGKFLRQRPGPRSTDATSSMLIESNAGVPPPGLSNVSIDSSAIANVGLPLTT